MSKVFAKLQVVALLLAALSSMPAVSSLTIDVAGAAQEQLSGVVYEVTEIIFRGPRFGAADAPARTVDFWVKLRHESGAPEYKIHGFWDGDGRGGTAGDVFKVRFAPTKAGRWRLVEVHSNVKELAAQRQGLTVAAAASKHKGFWIADENSPGRRWYRRADGSHQYIFGNTHYSFLSETRFDGQPNGSDIAADVTRNAAYFKKLRFSPVGDLYPHATAAPFLNDDGRPTYDGNHSHRPNPAWFRQRVDVAVDAAFKQDLIADLIMAGVDTESARAALLPAQNNQDPAPFLKYLAARYGAYPNVWFCLINEYDIRTPKFTPEQIKQFGQVMKSFLAYPNPLSVHRNSGPWVTALNTNPAWNDHVIVQRKLRTLHEAADFLNASHAAGGGDKPVIDDELAYEGAGDRFSEEDVIESHLGAFLGGSYGTTGHKTAGTTRRQTEAAQVSTGEAGTRPGFKLGQYFAGNFNAQDHAAADNLQWLRVVIDTQITFWRMAPDRAIFANADANARGLAWAERECVLGTSKAQTGIVAALPTGQWEVTMHDVIARTTTRIGKGVSGNFKFDAPASRAVLFHFKKIN